MRYLNKAVELALPAGAIILVAPFAVYSITTGGLVVIAWARSFFGSMPLSVTVFFDMPNFAVAYLLSDMSRFLVLTLACLVLLFGWLIRTLRRAKPIARTSPGIVLPVIGFIFVALFFLPPYQPAVQAAPSAEMSMVEQPDYLSGIVRRNMVIGEKPDCVYEVLGWADARSLVYRKWCGGYYDAQNNYQWKQGQPSSPLTYRVDTRERVSYSGDTGALARTTCNYSECILPRLARDYVHTWSPVQFYPASFDDSVISPGGRWVAFKAKYTYGPEDLLVIATR